MIARQFFEIPLQVKIALRIYFGFMFSVINVDEVLDCNQYKVERKYYYQKENYRIIYI